MYFSDGFSQYWVLVLAGQPMPDVVSQYYWYGPFGVFFAVWAIGLECFPCLVRSVILFDNNHSGVQLCLQYILV
jgi:hypothetical protein